MFEITRSSALDRPLRQFLSAFANDPFFRAIEVPYDTGDTLALDIEDVNGDVVVTASLPGFTKDQIDIKMHDGMLTIDARKEESKESQEGRYYRRERRVGSVSRTVALPKSVAFDKATAELKDGVLKITIPQAESAKPKQIAIK